MHVVWWKVKPSLELEPSLERVAVNGSIPVLIELLPEGISLFQAQVDDLWLHHVYVLIHIEFSLGNLALKEKH